MFLGFSGFLPHVIGLFRLFSAPEAFMLPASKAGVGGGGGGGGVGDDDMHCQLHQLQPFRLSREMPANQSKRCLLCGRHGHNHVDDETCLIFGDVSDEMCLKFGDVGDER